MWKSVRIQLGFRIPFAPMPQLAPPRQFRNDPGMPRLFASGIEPKRYKPVPLLP